jgi:hypothetical protein
MPSRLREAFPVTALGALAVAAFWFLGVRRLDLVLLSAATLLVLLLGLLVTATLVAGFLLRRRREVPEGRLALEGGVWNETGFRLVLSPWLPFLTLALAWETPAGLKAELEDGAERVLPGRRALLPQGLRRLRVGDILGLAEVGWTVPAGPVRILPQRSPLDPGAVLLGRVRGEEEADPLGAPQGDRVDLRKYGRGDPARMILWKVYARTRKTFVRIAEHAVDPAPRLCAYLPANPWDEPPARLARTLLERGLLGEGWRFGADGAEDAEDLEGALEALARSGSEPGNPGLGAFLQRARRDGFGACILLLPGKPGDWVSQVQAGMAGAPLRFHAVFALDGWAPAAEAPWRRYLLQAPPTGGAGAGEVLDLVSALVTPSMEATLVDTRSGDVLGRPEAFLRKRAGVAP